MLEASEQNIRYCYRSGIYRSTGGISICYTSTEIRSPVWINMFVFEWPCLVIMTKISCVNQQVSYLEFWLKTFFPRLLEYELMFADLMFAGSSWSWFFSCYCECCVISFYTLSFDRVIIVLFFSSFIGQRNYSHVPGNRQTNQISFRFHTTRWLVDFFWCVTS